MADLGRHFGGHLYEVEVRYLMREEWAVEPDDVLWRRTKEGLHMTPAERETFARWMPSLRPNSAGNPYDSPGTISAMSAL